MIKKFKEAIKANKTSIYVATALFVFSAAIGYLFIDQNNELIRSVFKQLEGIAQNIRTEDNVIYTVFTIFLNNIKSAFLMVLLGFFFGIFPFFALTINGLIIGFLLKIIIQSGQSINYFLVGIVPHGIFEIPAIIIAAAVGMNIGYNLLKYLVSLIIQSNNYEHTKNRFIKIIKQIPVVIIGVIAILFIAAIIESTVTGFLLTKLYS